MTGEQHRVTPESIIDIGPVIPVVVVEEAKQAVPLARALVRGGVRVIEITLRTPAAREAIQRVAAEVPEITVGAGSISSPRQVSSVVDAGARFLVLPGSPESLYAVATGSGTPVLPGVQTVTEAMRLLELGQRDFKFFPAEASGGAAFLAAIAGPLPDLRFCPTGGVTPDNARSFLRLPNVPCVGGSWLTPLAAVRSGDWKRIEVLAAQAAALSAGLDRRTAAQDDQISG